MEAGIHPGDLAGAALAVQPLHSRKGAAVFGIFAHVILPVGQRGDLGQMGDAKHLTAPADGIQLLAHPAGGPAGNTGVHLVKHRSDPLFPGGKDIFHGQHDAGKLAAGSHLAERLQILAHVGGKQEAHAVGALFGKAGLPLTAEIRDLGRKARAGQVKIGQFPANTGGQALRRLFPERVQAVRRLRKRGPLPGILLLELVQIFVQPVQRGKLGLQRGAVFLQPVGRDCVFHTKAGNPVKALLGLLQLLRRVFQRSDELGKRGRKILRQDRKLPRAALQPLGGGAEAGASAKGFHRLGQQIDGAFSSLFSVKGKGGLIQAVGDLFTVLQLRPQREKLLLLAGTDGGLLQLV